MIEIVAYPQLWIILNEYKKNGVNTFDAEILYILTRHEQKKIQKVNILKKLFDNQSKF